MVFYDECLEERSRRCNEMEHSYTPWLNSKKEKDCAFRNQKQYTTKTFENVLWNRRKPFSWQNTIGWRIRSIDMCVCETLERTLGGNCVFIHQSSSLVLHRFECSSSSIPFTNNIVEDIKKSYRVELNQ